MSKSTTPSARQSFREALLGATRLTGMGKLLDATRLIQRTLLGSPAASPRPSTYNPASEPTQTVKELPQAKHPAQGAVEPPVLQPQPDSIDVAPHVAAPAIQPFAAPAAPVTPIVAAPAASPEALPAAARKPSFTKHQFVFEGNAYPYRLYIPSALAATAVAPMPLIVLLHGCKQDALDFSHGTAMNELAEHKQAMVLYPEQPTSGNAMRCWNWFDPSHQQAGRGEPGMIAALARKMVAQQGADADRIYVAGLSAGGAMAAVVANLYPHVFAAVGVHSGLAAGAAQSMVQAFSAMQEGAKGSHTTALPTIVFHGTADQTVNPTNAKYITQAALAAFKADGVDLVKSKVSVKNPGDDTADRTLYTDANGRTMVESWRISAGPHAWSGGSAQGSYTDPDGPDASKAMLAFFLQHHKGQ